LLAQAGRFARWKLAQRIWRGDAAHAAIVLGTET
jgi:hypothetical protein